MFANSVNPWPTNTSPLGTGEKTAILEKREKYITKKGGSQRRGSIGGDDS